MHDLGKKWHIGIALIAHVVGRGMPQMEVPDAIEARDAVEDVAYLQAGRVEVLAGVGGFGFLFWRSSLQYWYFWF